MIDLPLDKILYHYTSSENASIILASRSIIPSLAGTYLSVNMSGNFDTQSPTGPKGLGWISGRSNFPNIFLTDTPPELINSEHFGSKSHDYVFWITIGDILNQNMSVYKNPSKEYPNVYNVPCSSIGTRLIIDPKKMIIIKNKI